MKAVILCNNEGTRLRPVTCSVPKSMLPVMNRPIAEHTIRLFKRHGIKEITFASEYLSEVIEKHFSTAKIEDVQISFSRVKNLCDFFDELLSGKYKIGNHTFMHNILVLSNNISDEEKYMQKVLNIDTLDFKAKNVSPQSAFKYFVTDGIAVITNIDISNINSILYDVLILESFKIYLMLSMVIDYDIHHNLNELIDNQIIVKSMFYPSGTPTPIITLNLIDALKQTVSFKRYEEAINFKIDTLKIYQERSKIKNGRLMNLLLYILTAFGSFQTLQILNDSFNVSIKTSVWFVLPALLVAGVYWFIKEKND